MFSIHFDTSSVYSRESRLGEVATHDFDSIPRTNMHSPDEPSTTPYPQNPVVIMVAVVRSTWTGSTASSHFGLEAFGSYMRAYN